MAILKYVGPNSADNPAVNGVMSVGAVDQQAAAIQPTAANLDARLVTKIAADGGLITKDDMNATLASYVSPSTVSSTLFSYVKLDELNAGLFPSNAPGYVGGMIKLDPFGSVPGSRVAVRGNPALTGGMIWSGTEYTSSPGQWAITAKTSIGTAEVPVFTVSIQDPGFRYLPIVTGYVEGKSDAADSRLDVVVRIGSWTGPLVAYGTAPPGFGAPTPVLFVPHAHGAFEGSNTLYVAYKKGYGGGSSSVSGFQTRIHVLTVPF